MTALQRVNLALRVLLEVGVVAALGYWGVHTGQNLAAKTLLGAGAPTLGFGLWGAVDFHRAAYGELLRLIQELAISGLAAIAWYMAGQHSLGLALASVSLGYHALVYASGERLLKPDGKPASRSSREASSTPSAIPAIRAASRVVDARVRAVIASLPERLLNEVVVARSAIANSYFRLWSRAARLSNDAESAQLGSPRADAKETDAVQERVDKE